MANRSIHCSLAYLQNPGLPAMLETSSLSPSPDGLSKLLHGVHRILLRSSRFRCGEVVLGRVAAVGLEVPAHGCDFTLGFLSDGTLSPPLPIPIKK